MKETLFKDWRVPILRSKIPEEGLLNNVCYR